MGVLDDNGNELDGEAGTDAFLAGQAEVTPDADGRVRVKDKLGRLGSVPAEQLEGFLVNNPGARLASAGEVEERRLQREYGEGAANEVRTALESTARTLTLGGSDVAIGALGGDEAREGLRERMERSPLARGTGELLGIGASLLATGGAGALARGLAATPAGAVARAGMALERGIGATSALGRAGAAAAAGSLEGAVFGAGQGVSEWALNPEAQERTAERLMASLGERAGAGALLGALAAGGVSAGASLAGAGARKAQSTLRSLFGGGDELAEGAAGHGLTADLVGTAEGRAGARSGARSEAGAGSSSRSTASATDNIEIEIEMGSGRSLGKDGPLKRLAEGASARQRYAARQQVATGEVTADLSKIARTADDIVSYTNVGLKPRPVLKALREAPVGSYDQTAGRVFDELTALRGRMELRIASQGEFREGGMRAFRKLHKELADFENEVMRGLSGAKHGTDEGLAEAFIGLDKLKRRIGRLQSIANKGIDGDPTAMHILRDEYQALRELLEDEAMWGTGASQLQREVNAAWSSYLDFAPAYESRFALMGKASTTRSARDGFESIAVADPARVGSALDNLGKAENAHVEEVLLEGSKRNAELMETLSKYYDVPELSRAAIAESRAAAKRVAGHVDELKRLRTVGDRFDETVQALADIPWIGGSLAKAKVTAGRALALTSESGSAAGAAAGAEVGAASSSGVGMGIGIGANVTGAAEAAGRRMGALQKLFAASEDVGRKLSSSIGEYARRASAGAKFTAASASGAHASRAERRKKYEQSYAQVREFSRDPEAAMRRVFRVQMQVGTVAPTLARAYAAQTLRAAQFLAEKAPTREAPTMFERDEEAPSVSDEEVREFLEYVRAVENPLTVVDDLAKGRVSPRAVEAVKAVYPRLYQDMRIEVMRSFEEAEEPPSYRARINLGILFDLPTDAALQPDFLLALQQSAAAAPSASSPEGGMLAPSRRSAPELAGLAETRSQSLAAH